MARAGVCHLGNAFSLFRGRKEMEFIENLFTRSLRNPEGVEVIPPLWAKQSRIGWNARNEYIRVYDPRDFEFEISVSNLLFILRECNCNKGKGLATVANKSMKI
jgi:hypothetical protein